MLKNNLPFAQLVNFSNDFTSFKPYKLENSLDTFSRRHTMVLKKELDPGMSDKEFNVQTKKKLDKMLSTIGVSTIDELIENIVPKSIYKPKEIEKMDSFFDNNKSGRIEGESDILTNLLKNYAELNDYNKKSMIGMGYYNVKVPHTILRNVLENPAWYTPYTPYQAEVSQGRLESLMNYQTMICELTGLNISNASLLDEGTAAGEAMFMIYQIYTQKKKNIVNKKLPTTLVVSKDVHPQTIGVLKTRAGPHNIKIVEVDDIIGYLKKVKKDDFKAAPLLGVLFQYPTTTGEVVDYKDAVDKVHKLGCTAICAADLLSLTILEPPSKFNFDIAVGSNQRMGLPMGNGGPHAGKKKY
jgi:glycine dehydrogenase